MAIVQNLKADHTKQVEKLTNEVTALRKQLREAQRLASVGTMAAMIAHEFNNILTPIISYAELAKKNPKLSEKAIAKAADGGQRATTICQAILGMTCPDSSSHSERVNIHSLVVETLEAMARKPEKDCIDLTIDIDTELNILTHRVELQQVFLNLILNARNATMASTHIRKIDIAAIEKDQNVTITISDTGVGIPAENIINIFEPFFTTHSNECSSNKGHGLGLTICREIINSLGGTISVESTLGKGATFTVNLPA